MMKCYNRMGLREKVALLVTVVILVEVTYTLCMPRTFKKSALRQHYRNLKRAKHNKGLPTYRPVYIQPNVRYQNDVNKVDQRSQPLNKARNFPEMPKTFNNFEQDVMTAHGSTKQNTVLNVPNLNDLRRKAKLRRKCANIKNNINNTTFEATQFTSDPDPFCFKNVGTFPEVEYPQSASEIWKPNFWNNMPPYNDQNQIADDFPDITQRKQSLCSNNITDKIATLNKFRLKNGLKSPLKLKEKVKCLLHKYGNNNHSKIAQDFVASSQGITNSCALPLPYQMQQNFTKITKSDKRSIAKSIDNSTIKTTPSPIITSQDVAFTTSSTSTSNFSNSYNSTQDTNPVCPLIQENETAGMCYITTTTPIPAFIEETTLPPADPPNRLTTLIPDLPNNSPITTAISRPSQSTTSTITESIAPKPSPTTGSQNLEASTPAPPSAANTPVTESAASDPLTPTTQVPLLSSSTITESETSKPSSTNDAANFLATTSAIPAADNAAVEISATTYSPLVTELPAITTSTTESPLFSSSTIFDLITSKPPPTNDAVNLVTTTQAPLSADNTPVEVSATTDTPLVTELPVITTTTTKPPLLSSSSITKSSTSKPPLVTTTEAHPTSDNAPVPVAAAADPSLMTELPVTTTTTTEPPLLSSFTIIEPIKSKPPSSNDAANLVAATSVPPSTENALVVVSAVTDPSLVTELPVTTITTTEPLLLSSSTITEPIKPKPPSSNDAANLEAATSAPPSTGNAPDVVSATTDPPLVTEVSVTTTTTTEPPLLSSSTITKLITSKPPSTNDALNLVTTTEAHPTADKAPVPVAATADPPLETELPVITTTTTEHPLLSSSIITESIISKPPLTNDALDLVTTTPAAPIAPNFLSLITTSAPHLSNDSSMLTTFKPLQNNSTIIKTVTPDSPIAAMTIFESPLQTDTTISTTIPSIFYDSVITTLSTPKLDIVAVTTPEPVSQTDFPLITTPKPSEPYKLTITSVIEPTLQSNSVIASTCLPPLNHPSIVKPTTPHFSLDNDMPTQAVESILPPIFNFPIATTPMPNQLAMAAPNLEPSLLNVRSISAMNNPVSFLPTDSVVTTTLEPSLPNDPLNIVTTTPDIPVSVKTTSKPPTQINTPNATTTKPCLFYDPVIETFNAPEPHASIDTDIENTTTLVHDTSIMVKTTSEPYLLSDLPCMLRMAPELPLLKNSPITAENTLLQPSLRENSNTKMTTFESFLPIEYPISITTTPLPPFSSDTLISSSSVLGQSVPTDIPIPITNKNTTLGNFPYNPSISYTTKPRLTLMTESLTEQPTCEPCFPTEISVFPATTHLPYLPSEPSVATTAALETSITTDTPIIQQATSTAVLRNDHSIAETIPAELHLLDQTFILPSIRWLPLSADTSIMTITTTLPPLSSESPITIPTTSRPCLSTNNPIIEVSTPKTSVSNDYVVTTMPKRTLPSESLTILNITPDSLLPPSSNKPTTTSPSNFPITTLTTSRLLLPTEFPTTLPNTFESESQNESSLTTMATSQLNSPSKTPTTQTKATYFGFESMTTLAPTIEDTILYSSIGPNNLVTNFITELPTCEPTSNIRSFIGDYASKSTTEATTTAPFTVDCTSHLSSNLPVTNSTYTECVTDLITEATTIGLSSMTTLPPPTMTTTATLTTLVTSIPSTKTMSKATTASYMDTASPISGSSLINSLLESNNNPMSNLKPSTENKKFIPLAISTDSELGSETRITEPISITSVVPTTDISSTPASSMTYSSKILTVTEPTLTTMEPLEDHTELSATSPKSVTELGTDPKKPSDSHITSTSFSDTTVTSTTPVMPSETALNFISSVKTTPTSITDTVSFTGTPRDIATSKSITTLVPPIDNTDLKNTTPAPPAVKATTGRTTIDDIVTTKNVISYSTSTTPISSSSILFNEAVNPITKTQITTPLPTHTQTENDYEDEYTLILEDIIENAIEQYFSDMYYDYLLESENDNSTILSDGSTNLFLPTTYQDRVTTSSIPYTTQKAATTNVNNITIVTQKLQETTPLPVSTLNGDIYTTLSFDKLYETTSVPFTTLNGDFFTTLPSGSEDYTVLSSKYTTPTSTSTAFISDSMSPSSLSSEGASERTSDAPIEANETLSSPFYDELKKSLLKALDIVVMKLRF